MTTKPKLPEPRPILRVPITLKAELIADFDRYSNGSLLMKFSDTDVKIQNTETDEEVGAVGMAIGGVLYVEIGQRTYTLDICQLFDAINIAEQSETSNS